MELQFRAVPGSSGNNNKNALLSTHPKKKYPHHAAERETWWVRLSHSVQCNRECNNAFVNSFATSLQFWVLSCCQHGPTHILTVRAYTHKHTALDFERVPWWWLWLIKGSWLFIHGSCNETVAKRKWQWKSAPQRVRGEQSIQEFSLVTYMS